MIRPFTVLCLFAACGSGLYLYSEKHRTGLLDRDIAHVIYASEAARARTGLLRAEWALLNEPGRLQDMSGRYLALRPMAPTQFVQMASLSAHLPAPMATPPVEDEEAPAAESPTAVAGAAEPLLPPPASAAKTAEAPALLLADRTDAKPSPKQMASAALRQRPPHRLALADHQDYGVRDGMMAHSTPLPLAAPQPVGASVYSAMARPMRVASARPAIVSAVPSYAPAQAYTPQQSYAQVRSYAPSALGGAGSLPPPTPYGR